MISALSFTNSLIISIHNEAYINLKGKEGKTMADQLTTVSKIRVLEKADKLTLDEMSEINKVIKTQLSLK